MTRPVHARNAARRHSARAPEPWIWTFEGPFAECLADVEDTLGRAIVELSDVSGAVVALDLSLPALASRVAAGDSLQPAWGRFLARVAQDYGLPQPMRVRHRPQAGPLATLVIIHRS
jgi:hypothetical protein